MRLGGFRWVLGYESFLFVGEISWVDKFAVVGCWDVVSMGLEI